MKNMGKILGIVAVIAMIVLTVGCSGPADPEDQVLITVTDIGSNYDNQYAYIVLIDDITADTLELTAWSTVSKRIIGGIVTCEMKDDKGAWGKDETLYVAIYINKTEDPNDKDNSLYTGFTSSAKAIVKGGNIVSAKDFYPDSILAGAPITEPDPEEKVATFLGTYKTSYKTNATGTKTIAETIDLTNAEAFVISDNDGDKLTFRIDEWDYAATPVNYIKDYPNAFKFKGKILTSTAGYYGTNSQTGKGIAAGDIKEDGTGPTCWMYLYFSDKETVIRTPFTKTGDTENTVVVLQYTSGPLRIYTKQQ